MPRTVHPVCRHLLSLCALVFAMLLTSCAKPVVTKVTRLHKLTKSPAPRTYTIACTAENTTALERDLYAQRIVEALNKVGWRQAPENKAEVMVLYTFEISKPYEVKGYRPEYSHVPGRTVESSGSFSYSGSTGRYSGSTYVPGYSYVSGYTPYSYNQYRRQLYIFCGSRKNEPCFEIQCDSWGSSNSAVYVIPRMLTAAFKNFPGTSGKTKTYRVH